MCHKDRSRRQSTCSTQHRHKCFHTHWSHTIGFNLKTSRRSSHVTKSQTWGHAGPTSSVDGSDLVRQTKKKKRAQSYTNHKGSHCIHWKHWLSKRGVQCAAEVKLSVLTVSVLSGWMLCLFSSFPQTRLWHYTVCPTALFWLDLNVREEVKEGNTQIWNPAKH